MTGHRNPPPIARSGSVVIEASLLVALAVVACNASAADTRRGDDPRIDVAESRITEWSVPTPLAARDPIPDAGDNIYFAVSKGDRIARFDSKSTLFKEWNLPAGTRPHGIALAQDGKVLFGGYGNGTIGELDPRTGAVRMHRISNQSSGPYSIVLDAQGRVWGALRKAGKVVRLDRATGAVSEHPFDGEPYGLAFDRRGILWISRIAADKLTSLDPNTGKTTELYTGAGSKPRRLALGRDGMLWVSLYGTGRIICVDTSTSAIVKSYELPGGPNTGPYAIDVDTAGRVWIVAHQTNSIVVFDPKGEKFRIIRLTGKNLGIRNAAIDPRGRYWYISTTAGKLGVIE